MPPKARWQSGHAAACKAVYAGSIPTLASTPISTLVHRCLTRLGISQVLGTLYPFLDDDRH
jgi:hypothetical protein